MVATVSAGHPVMEYVASLVKLVEFDRAHGFNRLRFPWFFYIRSSANLARARNEAMRTFLGMDGSPAWLLMVDDDMAWREDALERLMVEATEERIVGGLCFAYGANQSIIPTVYVSNGVGQLRPKVELEPGWWPPENTMLQVDATGAAFLLVHRSALEAMASTWRSRFGASDHLWFQEREVLLPIPNAPEGSADHLVSWTSEDLWFCRLASEAGVEVFVHTGVEVRHRKEVWLTSELAGSDYSAMSW